MNFLFDKRLGIKKVYSQSLPGVLTLHHRYIQINKLYESKVAKKMAHQFIESVVNSLRQNF